MFGTKVNQAELIDENELKDETQYYEFITYIDLHRQLITFRFLGNVIRFELV